MWMYSFVSVLFVCECVYFRVCMCMLTTISFVLSIWTVIISIAHPLSHQTPPIPTCELVSGAVGFREKYKHFSEQGCCLFYLSCPPVCLVDLRESVYLCLSVVVSDCLVYLLRQYVCLVCNVCLVKQFKHTPTQMQWWCRHAGMQTGYVTKQTDTLAKKLLKKLHEERATDKHEGRYSSRQDGRAFGCCFTTRQPDY